MPFRALPHHREFQKFTVRKQLADIPRDSLDDTPVPRINRVAIRVDLS